MQKEVSLDTKLSKSDEENDFRVLDMIPYLDDGFDRAECTDLISSMMNIPGLTEREKQAITGVIIQGRKQKEVGQLIGIQQSVVSRYVRSGIRKMQTVFL